MTDHSTLPRRVLVGSAWATPVVLVGAAAPAFAASGGTIVATFATQRLSTGVTFTGTVTNGGPTAVVVTAAIRIDVLTPAGAIITGGSGNGTVAGWQNLTLGAVAGSANRAATWSGRTRLALPAGATIQLGRPTFNVSDAAATGTAQLTLSAPSPAVVVQPAPAAFAGYAAAP